LKDQGNKAFQAKEYDSAISLFSQAIALDPQNHVLYSNRSAAKAGKKQWASALEDAEEVNIIYSLSSPPAFFLFFFGRGGERGLSNG
jgi:tetratricopeptide (TPR) repeat protein